MSATNLNDTVSHTHFKQIQMDFLKWAVNWFRTEDNLQTSCVDLPDVVNLLQAMGYRITYVSQSGDFSPLRGAQGGSRVVTTCSYSGQRCVLEHPDESENCKCLKAKKVDVAKDAFWEVVATTPKNRQSLVESGSDMIPTMGKEKGKVIKHIMNYLVHMMKQTEFKELGSIPDLNMTPVTTRGRGRVSDPCGMVKQNSTPLRNSLQLDSPARYRSLDTLTAKDAEVGLPEPGNLVPKIAIPRPDIMVIQSSPNIKLSVDEVHSSTSTIGDIPFPPKALTLIRSASESLVKALHLLEGKSPKASSSPSSVFEEKLLSASKNIKKFMCASKPPTSTSTLKTISSPNLTTTKRVPKSRLPSKSTGSYTVTSKLSKPTVRKVSASTAQEVLPKRTDKYSHIKSTIPKAEKKK